MIGSKYDKGVMVYSAVFQGADDAPDVFIYSGDAGVIVADMFPEVVAFGCSFGGNIGLLGCQCFYVEVGIPLFE